MGQAGKKEGGFQLESSISATFKQHCNLIYQIISGYNWQVVHM